MAIKNVKINKRPDKLASEIRGNALLMLLPLVIFMLIFGYSLIRRSTSEHTQSFLVHRQNVVTYLAEGCLNIAMEYVKTNLDSKFKKDLIEKNVKLLNAYEKYPEIKKNVDALLAAMPEAELIKLTIDFPDTADFEALPKNKHEKMGLLVFSCGVKYYDTSTTLKITRDIKIVNISPPAENFTFYTNIAPKDESEINHGPSLMCSNKDESSKAVGDIRIVGGLTGNVINIGERYAWEDLTKSPMPNLSKSVLFRKERAGLTTGIPTMPNLPSAVVDFLTSTLEANLSADHLLDVEESSKKKIFYCIISFEKRRDDLIKQAVVYGGVPLNAVEGEPKLDSDYRPDKGRGKVRLHGNYSVENEKLSKIYMPGKIYGRNLKKKYGEFKIIEKEYKIPVQIQPLPAPPTIVTFYVYYPEAKPSRIIVEAHSSGDNRTFKPIDSDDEGRIGLDGCASLKDTDYKKRAFYLTSEINLNTMSMFERNGVYRANGIIFANDVSIGSDRQPLRYDGRYVIVADKSMRLNNDVICNENTAKSYPSNLSLVFFPRGASQMSLSLPSLKFKTKPKLHDGKSYRILSIDANLFSYNGLEYEKASDSEKIVNTYLYLHGNLSVERYMPKKFYTHLDIHYKKRLLDKDYQKYVVNMSPIYSSWFEEKKGGK